VKPPIRSDPPKPGLDPLELAQASCFRWRAVSIRLLALALSAT
jgi:hypothetical protein